MKKIYLMGLTSFFALAAIAQTTLKVNKPLQSGKNAMISESKIKKGASAAKGGGSNSTMAIAANMVVSTSYTAGSAQNIDMVLTLTNTDNEYGDKLEITFPAGITVNSTTNTPTLGPDDGGASSDGPEAFNGITGQTISWGNDDNYYGGISSSAAAPGSYPIQINITVPAGTTGNIVCTYSVSGDGFGASPADYTGTFNIVNSAVPAVNMKTIFVQPYNLASLSNCNYGLDTLVAQITNIGTTTESNINVSYNVNGGTAMMTVVPGPLAPGDSTFVFWLPAYDFSATNTYDLKAWVAQAADINLVNDTASLSFSNNVSIALSTTSYSNGIEGAQVADIAVQGTAANFTGLSGATVHSGAQALFTTVNTTTVTANQGVYDVFISLPCMDVVNGETYRISYWKKVNNAPATHQGSGGIFSGLSNDATTMTALKPFSPITPTGAGAINWSKDSVDFVSVANETRYFAVAGQGTVSATSSFNFRVDDIKIAKVTSSVGIKGNTLNQLISIFPNPTAGILNINAIEANGTIEVYNVIGDKVYSNSVVKGNNSIDLSGLANGAYFLKVNSNNQIISKKVVLSK
jgi:hypothetical protein